MSCKVGTSTGQDLVWWLLSYLSMDFLWSSKRRSEAIESRQNIFDRAEKILQKAVSVSKLSNFCRLRRCLHCNCYWHRSENQILGNLSCRSYSEWCQDSLKSQIQNFIFKTLASDPLLQVASHSDKNLGVPTRKRTRSWGNRFIRTDERALALTITWNSCKSEVHWIYTLNMNRH